MAFGLLFLILLNFVLLAAVALPLSRAMGGALAFARDPAVRVLPGESWGKFLDQFRRRLKWWPWVWGATLVFLPSLLVALSSMGERFMPLVKSAHLWGSVFCILLSHLVFIAMIVMMFAPRMSEALVAVLAGVGSIVAFWVMFIGWAALGAWLKTFIPAAQWLYQWRYEERSANGMFYAANYPIQQYYIVILLALALWWVWRRARNQGEDWFRFEE